MQLHNDSRHYGLVTQTIHWATLVVLIAQFTIGYLIADDSGHGRGRGRGDESGRGRGRGGDDDFTFGFGDGDDTLLTMHVILGLTILTLTTLRLIWRRTTPLPAWATTLSHRERTFAHWTELALYACLFAIPVSGLSLVFLSDDLLLFHVAAHVAFFVALALHLGLVLKHQFVNRDHLVQRML